MPSSFPPYASDYKLLKLSYPSAGVLHLELNRFWKEFGRAFDQISLDVNVRAVVVSSAFPKVFSAGIDFQFLKTLVPGEDAGDPARRAILIRYFALEFQRAFIAVHGQVLGLAIDFIAACDIRLAAADTTFCIKETAVGLATDIGTLARLPKLTGNASLLHELALTARSFGCPEALSLGLISRAVPGSRTEVVQAALEMGAQIAQHSPLATLGTKRFLANARERTVPEALEYQATWNMAAVQAPDLETTARAIMKKEQVKYKPLAPWVQPESKSKL
ncbi:ClpP/crotonase [Auriculariales sp. MPI-PUGE-AT-0066]|nr:ClpP/crotonase [Auriculariales sp. MPI-PUGE-AT-0066]